jgi:hypothetical protein
MNLVQVQEHLKDVPLQALMGYANGSSQMVPPYLALGEMNRRKQMEKRAAEPPKSTVKDELEQQVQPPAMMSNQAMMQPPMEEMATEDHAYGGITGLPANFYFDGGGIVSFKEGSKDAVKETTEEEGKRSKLSNLLHGMFNYDKQMAQLEERDKDPNSLGPAMLVKGAEYATMPSSEYEKKYPAPKPPLPVDPNATTNFVPYQPNAAENARLANIQANGIPSQAPPPNLQVRPPVRPPAPGIGGLNQGAPQQTTPQQTQVAAPPNPFMDQLLKATQATPETLPDFEAKRRAAEGQDEYLKKKPGELMETEIASQRKRQEDARQRFEENEKARTRSDLWANLIKAGKATAGRKGIGALVGGYGEASIASEEEARQRREQFENLDNEKNLNFTKMNQEIENARIARSEGRFKDAYAHEIEAKKFERENKKIQNEAAGLGAQVLSGENIAKEKNLNALEVQRLHGLNNLEVQRLHNLSANRPGETERMMAEYANIKASKGEAAAEEYMKNLERIKTGSRGATAQESLAIKRQALLDKNTNYQMASAAFYNAKDPDKKAKAKATMDAIEQRELGITPSAVDTSGFGEPRVKSTK